MPAYILRAVERTGSTRLIDDLYAAVSSGKAPYSTPVLADDAAAALDAFVAAHGKALNPIAILSSNELEAMQGMIADASGGTKRGCLLFGVPTRDKRYSPDELPDLFLGGRVRFAYAALDNLEQALNAATAHDPSTSFFGGASSSDLEAELQLLEDLTAQHLPRPR